MTGTDKNRFLIQLSGSDNTSFGKVDFLDQREDQKVFSAIWALESQVNNGGFAQYFSSWDGETASFAPTALRAIGAEACASLVERALAQVSLQPLATGIDEREALMNGLSADARENLDALDSEFFLYPDNLTDLLYDFVLSRPEEFRRFA